MTRINLAAGETIELRGVVIEMMSERYQDRVSVITAPADGSPLYLTGVEGFYYLHAGSCACDDCQAEYEAYLESIGPEEMAAETAAEDAWLRAAEHNDRYAAECDEDERRAWL